MLVINYHIKITHETHGVLLNETFVNGSQFKLFLKMIQGCIEVKENLMFFNGVDFLIHIPYKHLVESIISANSSPYTLADHVATKSKIEALETREYKQQK